MKKITMALLAFCTAFLFVIIVIRCGHQSYQAVFDGKTELIIERKMGQTVDDYVQDIYRVSEDNSLPVFHCMIRDSSLIHPVFDVYTTSFDRNFIDVRLDENPDASASYYTTVFSDKSSAGWIINLPLFEDIILYPFSGLQDFSLSQSRFFVPSSRSDEAKSAFLGAGYTVFIPDQSGERLSDTTTELFRMMLIMNLVFFLSAAYVAFGNRREIVIKKINGYGERDVFSSTFLRMVLRIPFVVLIVFVILCIVIGVRYPAAVLSFVSGTWYIFILYAAVCMAIVSLICFLIQSGKRTVEIRGFHSSRILYIAAMLSRIVIVFAAAFGITYVHDVIRNMINLQRTYHNSEALLEDYVTLSLNEGSTMLSQDEEYMKRSCQLLKTISGKYNMIVIDSGDFFSGMEDETDGILYVSKEYFDIENAWYDDGTRIRSEDFEGRDDEIIYIIPDTADPEIEQQLSAEGIVYHYKSPQSFHTFSEMSAIDTGGLLKDPILTLADNEYMQWSSEYLIGEQFVFIKATAEDMYQELLPLITKAGMDTVVLEAPYLKTVFLSSIASEAAKTTEYAVFGVFCLFAMLFAAFFESAVYYSNHRRILTIRRLHGFGWNSYRVPLLLKLLTAVLLITAAYFTGIYLRYMVLAVLLDLLAFLFFMNRLEKNNMALYLKGDF